VAGACGSRAGSAVSGQRSWSLRRTEGPCNDPRRVPRSVVVEGHVLDEAHLEAALAPEGGERLRLELVHAGEEHGIDLDRREATSDRRVEPGEHGAQPVAPRHPRELLAVQGVEADVQAERPRGREIPRLLGEEHAVGRQRQAVEAGDRGETLDEPWEVAPDERLAPGDADLPHPRPDRDPRHTRELLERQERLAREPHRLLGHAVGAPEVAAVGHREPQVVVNASERVDEGQGGDLSRLL
jgi:hypothetical protein